MLHGVINVKIDGVIFFQNKPFGISDMEQDTSTISDSDTVVLIIDTNSSKENE